MMKNKKEEYEKEDKKVEGKKADIPLSVTSPTFWREKKNT